MSAAVRGPAGACRPPAGPARGCRARVLRAIARRGRQSGPRAGPGAAGSGSADCAVAPSARSRRRPRSTTKVLRPRQAGGPDARPEHHDRQGSREVRNRTLTGRGRVAVAALAAVVALCAAAVVAYAKGGDRPPVAAVSPWITPTLPDPAFIVSPALI